MYTLRDGAPRIELTICFSFLPRAVDRRMQSQRYEQWATDEALASGHGNNMSLCYCIIFSTLSANDYAVPRSWNERWSSLNRTLVLIRHCLVHGRIYLAVLVDWLLSFQSRLAMDVSRSVGVREVAHTCFVDAACSLLLDDFESTVL